jgi:ketosteroid isomerase-like protein
MDRRGVERYSAAVSQEHVEVVRGQFDATNRRDFPTAMDAYAEDVVLVVHWGLAAGTYSGREAVGNWFGDWFRAFGGDYHFDIDEARVVDERVLLFARHRGSGRSSGVAVEASGAYLYTVEAGKIAHVEMWDDRSGALKAAGLEA